MNPAEIVARYRSSGQRPTDDEKVDSIYSVDDLRFAWRKCRPHMTQQMAEAVIRRAAVLGKAAAR